MKIFIIHIARSWWNPPPNSYNHFEGKKAWDLLPQLFQGTDSIRTIYIQLLWRDFEVLQMLDLANIRDFFTHAMGLINQMKSHGEVITNQKIVEKILRCLPSKYDPIIIAILKK